MNIVSLNKNNNIILIDCSYYIFHRYFATYRWFSFQKIEVDINDIVENEIFINAFYKHINNDIKKICKFWKTTNINKRSTQHFIEKEEKDAILSLK